MTIQSKHSEFKYQSKFLFNRILLFVKYSFCLLAIYNIFFFEPRPKEGITASIVWLIFVFIFVCINCLRYGIKQHLIDSLGSFIENRFAEINENENGEILLSFGFKFFSKKFYFFKIKTNGIKTISWDMGQASDVFGEDKDDWSVIIWLDKDSIVYDIKSENYGVYIVGYSGKRELIEKFGYKFLDFLISNRIHLNIPPKNLIEKEFQLLEKLERVGKVFVENKEFYAIPIKYSIEDNSNVKIKEIRGTTLILEKV